MLRKLNMAAVQYKTRISVEKGPTLYKGVMERHLLQYSLVLTNTTFLGLSKTGTGLFAFVSLIRNG